MAFFRYVKICVKNFRPLLILSSGLVENHCFGTIDEHPLLTPPLDGGGQNLALDITAFVDELLGGEVMIHSGDALLDNGALVEIGGDEMGGGTDDFDAAVVGLVVGLGAFEGGQERVVDVDDLARHGGAQAGGQDLHVAGEHDELDPVLPDQLQDLGLLLLLRVLGHGQVVEFNPVALRQRRELGVVRHDHGHLDRQLARLLAEQQVVQAVPDLRHHDQHLGLGRHRPQLVVHVQLRRQGFEVPRQELRPRLRRGPKVHAHEEFLRRPVRKLLQVQDVQVVPRKDPRHRVDDAWLVRA